MALSRVEVKLIRDSTRQRIRPLSVPTSRFSVMGELARSRRDEFRNNLLRALWDVSRLTGAKRRNTMQTQQTITLFGTVSNSATSRTSKKGRKCIAFGVSIISDRNLQASSYNVVAWGK
jgi:hypothetical protein